LSIEFKKVFMDEWSGALDEVRHAAIGAALATSIPPTLSSLESLPAP
jgi:hypothetical protein